MLLHTVPCRGEMQCVYLSGRGILNKSLCHCVFKKIKSWAQLICADIKRKPVSSLFVCTIFKTKETTQQVVTLKYFLSTSSGWLFFAQKKLRLFPKWNWQKLGDSQIQPFKVVSRNTCRQRRDFHPLKPSLHCVLFLFSSHESVSVSPLRAAVTLGGCARLKSRSPVGSPLVFGPNVWGVKDVLL